jgi:hypothetical protein
MAWGPNFLLTEKRDGIDKQGSGRRDRQRPRRHVTSDDVHHGGPGGVEGRSSSPSIT